MEQETKEQEVPKLLEQLFAPWKLDDYSFRPGHKNKDNDCRVFAYLNKETIMDRLDSVLGPLAWSVKYKQTLDGWLCSLALCIGGVWYEKQGVGGQPDMNNKQDSVKGGGTDAFRQAADAWGFGRRGGPLPVWFWKVNTNTKGGVTGFADYNGLRAKFAQLMGDRLAGNARRGSSASGASSSRRPERKPDAAETTSSSESGGNGSKPPKPVPLANPKPESGLPRTSTDMIPSGMKENLIKAAGSLERLNNFAKQEFLCTAEDLSRQAGAWLHEAITRGSVVLGGKAAEPEPEKTVTVPPELFTPEGAASERMTNAAEEARAGIRKALGMTVEQAAEVGEEEASGFQLFTKSLVTREAKGYKVQDGESFHVTQPEPKGAIHCSCGSIQPTATDASCRHIHAVRFFAATLKARAVEATQTT